MNRNQQRNNNRGRGQQKNRWPNPITQMIELISEELQAWLATYKMDDNNCTLSNLLKIFADQNTSHEISQALALDRKTWGFIPTVIRDVVKPAIVKNNTDFKGVDADEADELVALFVTAQQLKAREVAQKEAEKNDQTAKKAQTLLARFRALCSTAQIDQESTITDLIAGATELDAIDRATLSSVLKERIRTLDAEQEEAEKNKNTAVETATLTRLKELCSHAQINEEAEIATLINDAHELSSIDRATLSSVLKERIRTLDAEQEEAEKNARSEASRKAKEGTPTAEEIAKVNAAIAGLNLSISVPRFSARYRNRLNQLIADLIPYSNAWNTFFKVLSQQENIELRKILLDIAQLNDDDERIQVAYDRLGL